MLGILLSIYLGLTHSHALPAQPREALALPAEISARLALKPSPAPALETPTTDPDGQAALSCEASFQRVEGAEERSVRFDYYEARADGAARRPVVVVNPITGGGYELERLIARDLCAHGYHAVVVKRPPRALFLAALESFDAFEESMRDTVAAGRRVIDWLEDRPEVDPTRIAAYGVSLGGMLTVMLSASDARIVASVAIMAGGDFPAVLARSIEPEARRFAQANGLPENPSAAQFADFETRARGTIHTDPLAFAPYVDPRAIFLVNTRRDTSVPSPLQVRLRDALGSPETLSLPTGHYSVGAYLPIVLQRARAFIERRFEARDVPPVIPVPPN